eukprot:1844316-Heterocapsa_arctica.AAC.1
MEPVPPVAADPCAVVAPPRISCDGRQFGVNCRETLGTDPITVPPSVVGGLGTVGCSGSLCRPSANT